MASSGGYIQGLSVINVCGFKGRKRLKTACIMLIFFLVSGKVEGQPNGDTVPAEQANPSDDTVAGAGSRQNDQIVQKIEEVLSGALDTELQSKSGK